MLDSYHAANHDYRPYIQRARRLRSEAFHVALGSVAGAVLRWLRAGFERLNCRRIQHRAEKQLNTLSSAMLKDIGVSRGEISWRVREALPCS